MAKRNRKMVKGPGPVSIIILTSSYLGVWQTCMLMSLCRNGSFGRSWFVAMSNEFCFHSFHPDLIGVAGVAGAALPFSSGVPFPVIPFPAGD